ncbi:MAG TPA: phosphoribosyltransferase family protein [Streptosporangiaceae bacterium]|jgi:putative phosphoribosyl transferase
MRFRDRSDAGQRLGARLRHLSGEDLVVLGLPRGGVAVAAEVARILGAPLDVILVRKLGVPAQPELGMGAIGEGGARVINPDIVTFARVSDEALALVEERERAELLRRARRYRGGRPRLSLTGRTAVVVDDGVATGSTARAACEVAKAQGAKRVVLAVPVSPAAAAGQLAGDADEFISLTAPGQFQAIGEWYDDFSQTSDEEVVSLLRQPPPSQLAPSQLAPSQPGSGQAGPSQRAAGFDAEVEVLAGSTALPGHLTVPAPGAGIVVFAHGSGSSRHSPRNGYVAGVLHAAGLGTLLFDLLTPGEDADRANVFDTGLLARRLSGATRWLRGQPPAAGAPVGYFGASTGAAAALLAAGPGSDIAAVVSRGGRPDLAMPALPSVQAPTLLIVGGRDEQVLRLNRQAQALLRCENDLAVIAGASHLFEEPGTLEQAAARARDWFTRHLTVAAPHLDQ